jgi:hypothetical protein
MSTTPVAFSIDKNGFLRGWLLANIGGAIVGEVIAVALYFWVKSHPNLLYVRPIYPNLAVYEITPMNAAVVGGILFGIILIGLGEQLIIRRYTHLRIRWLLASIIGSTVGGSIYIVLFIPLLYLLAQDYIFLPILETIAGFYFVFVLIIGFMQWITMRKTIFRSVTWIWTRIWSSLVSLFLFIPSIPCCIWSMLFNKGPSGGFTYFLLLIFLPIPTALNARITGLFMSNLLDNSARNLFLSPVGEENHLETPAEDEINIQ